MPPRDGHVQGPAAETPVLWHLEISHYNEKVRWALDYKGVAHMRRPVTPALQEFTARRLRAGRTVPVLEMNGHAIGDSTKAACGARLRRHGGVAQGLRRALLLAVG